MKIMTLGMSRLRFDELQEIFSKSMSESPFKITWLEAADLKEALTLYHDEFPDLVLIEITNRGEEGELLCEHIRVSEEERHTGVIFLGLPPGMSDDVAVAFLEIGADDVVRIDASPLEIKARCIGVLKLKSMTDRLRSANHQLSRLSLTDDLSGLHNMRSFNQLFAEVSASAKNGERSFGLMMIDLDYFKSVNDTTNHLMGSHVLSRLGLEVRKSGLFSKGDVAARFGGDEFVFLTEDKTFSDLKKKAESLRTLIEGLKFENDGFQIRLTASIGAAFCGKYFYHDSHSEFAMKAADMLLYISKELGRNRVTASSISVDTDLDQLRESLIKEVKERPRKKSA